MRSLITTFYIVFIMTEILFLGCPICGKFTPQKIANWKVGDPAELGLVSVRSCMGKKGFIEIDRFSISSHFSEFSDIINELCDFCSGVLTHCFLETNLPLHKPYIILKYEQLLHQTKDHDIEDALRLDKDDLNRQILQLIATIKKERDERENLGFELDDANRKISEQEQVIDRYENASLQ